MEILFHTSPALNQNMTIMSSWQGLLGGFFGSLGSGLVNTITGGFGQRRQYKYQSKLQRQQYELNEKAADSAFQRQLQQWQMENEYNDPSQVRSRYENAGLNPYSAFGTAGSYTPQQMSSAPQGGGSGLGSASAFPIEAVDPLTAARQLAEIERVKAETKKIQGDTKDPEETQRGQELTNSLLEQQIIGQLEANTCKAIDAEFARVMAETNLEKERQSISNMRTQVEEANARIQTLIDQHNNNPAVVEELKSRAWLNFRNAALADAKAQLARAGITLTAAQVDKLEAETETIDGLRGLQKANLYNEVLGKGIENQIQSIVKEWTDTNYKIDNGTKMIDLFVDVLVSIGKIRKMR